MFDFLPKHLGQLCPNLETKSTDSSSGIQDFLLKKEFHKNLLELSSRTSVMIQRLSFQVLTHHTDLVLREFLKCSQVVLTDFHS